MSSFNSTKIHFLEVKLIQLIYMELVKHDNKPKFSWITVPRGDVTVWAWFDNNPKDRQRQNKNTVSLIWGNKANELYASVSLKNAEMHFCSHNKCSVQCPLLWWRELSKMSDLMWVSTVLSVTKYEYKMGQEKEIMIIISFLHIYTPVFLEYKKNGRWFFFLCTTFWKVSNFLFFLY